MKNGNGRLMMPGPQQQQMPLILCQPLDQIGLAALIAAHCPGDSAAQQVTKARELLMHAILMHEKKPLAKLVEEAQQ